ncbi:hypothetical protein JCM17478_27300 [Thermopirellula anaerolimosa]
MFDQDSITHGDSSANTPDYVEIRSDGQTGRQGSVAPAAVFQRGAKLDLGPIRLYIEGAYDCQRTFGLTPTLKVFARLYQLELLGDI